MACYTYRMMQVARHEFRLDAPTNATELEKMSAAAWAEKVKQLGGVSPSMLPDDAITVSVEDDCIVLWWETQQNV